jgi:hypothetical protein
VSAFAFAKAKFQTEYNLMGQKNFPNSILHLPITSAVAIPTIAVAAFESADE